MDEHSTLNLTINGILALAYAAAVLRCVPAGRSSAPRDSRAATLGAIVEQRVADLWAEGHPLANLVVETNEQDHACMKTTGMLGKDGKVKTLTGAVRVQVSASAVTRVTTGTSPGVNTPCRT